jgi:hypothetical protein
MKRALSEPFEVELDHGRWLPDAPGTGRSQRDPRWLLCVLSGANDDVSLVGAADVRGVPTERFRCTLDFHRAAHETPGGLGAPDVLPRRWLRHGPLPIAPEAMPAEVWLDNQQRIRRASVAPLIRRGDERVLWMVVELYEFSERPSPRRGAAAG